MDWIRPTKEDLFLIEMEAERIRGKGGNCVHPTQIASSAWEKCSRSHISSCHLLIFISLRKLYIWRDEKKMQMDGKWMSRNKAIITVWLVAMANLVKELTNPYSISEKHYKASCLLQQIFQTTAAHTGKMSLSYLCAQWRAEQHSWGFLLHPWQLLLQVTELKGRFLFTLPRWCFTAAIS